MIYLNDLKFLRNICSQRQQTIYAKINLLDNHEVPITSIEGIVTGGNVSIDGTSALARNCSLNLTIPDISPYNETNWVLKDKIQVFIGVLNNTEQYEEFPIIYFPMGIFYLFTFNINKSTSGYTISLQGKDKMCKLTGDLGGLFNAFSDLGTIDIVDLINNYTKKESIPIKNIITELVHFYGQEPYEKIFINDIDDYGLNLITCRSDTPLYYFIQFRDYKGEIIPLITNCRFGDTHLGRKIDNKNYLNVIEDSEHELISNFEEDNALPREVVSFNIIKNILNEEDIRIKNIQFFKYNAIKNAIEPCRLLDNNGNEIQEEILNELNYWDYIDIILNENNEDKFIIGRYKYGDTIGYELTSLIFPGDLTANPGESVTSVLDKIKKVLGNFIYFYDLNGNFVFKKKNEYLDENEPLTISFSLKNPEFALTNKLITSLAYSYNLSNIKNDFIVWGEAKSTTGATMDIHARYAIDEKPEFYITFDIDEERAAMLIKKYPNLYRFDKTIPEEQAIKQLIQKPVCYYEIEHGNNNLTIENIQVDWREIIYRMALDYNKFNQIDEYKDWLREYNIQYQDGETGYERYYTDLLGFWRTIYKPDRQILVPQLQDLQADDNIEYDIELMSPEDTGETRDGYAEQSLTYTTKGIKDGGGKQFALNSKEQLERIEELKYAKNLLKYNTVFELTLKGGSKYFNRYYPWSNRKYYQKIKWDIKSDNFPNVKMYKKIYNQDNEGYNYVEVGYLNDIIETNYKILGYMYYLLNPWVYWDSIDNGYREYLIREDMLTHVTESYTTSKLLRIMDFNATQKYSERYNFYNNAGWYYIKDGIQSFLGIYYDILDLYFDSSYLVQVIASNEIEMNYYNDLIELVNPIVDPKSIDSNSVDSIEAQPESEIQNILRERTDLLKEEAPSVYENIFSSLKLNMANKITYLQLKDYPKNKNGDSLTNILFAEYDKMGLLLWARANQILIETDNNYDERGYRRDIFEQPDKLQFWFDFLSVDKFNQTYSVRNIGPREIIKKDASINCISSQAIPDMIFINPSNGVSDTPEKQIKIYKSYFKQSHPTASFLQLDLEKGKQSTKSYTTKSAIDVIMNLIYNHAIAPNSLTVTGIPQYYLKPDSFCQILDNQNTINKQYLINKISFSFDHNGMMTLNVAEFNNDELDQIIIREVILDT